MDDKIKLLQEELAILEKATDILLYSYKKCKNIAVKPEYSYEELDNFEALTSRFARLSDIIIQKIFRLFDVIDLEENGTVQDRINRAEKRGLIDKASIFVKIRELRNSIAHEYLPDVFKAIYKEVFELTPILCETTEKIKACSRRYLKK